MLNIAFVFFVTSLFLILYVTVFYPFILVIWRKLRKHKRDAFVASPTDLPSVTLVIAVYNEQDVLRDKLSNLREIHYPSDRITFLFGSDHSTDETNNILSNAGNDRLILKSFSQRRGKAAVLNDLIPSAEGEIVVLSDANTFYRSDSIQNLVQFFKDPEIGAVCGTVLIQAKQAKSSELGEETYWEYDNWLKKLEAEIRTTIAANGGFYAIRKSLFRPLPASKSVADDIYIPLTILQQGFHVAFASTALAFEHPSNSVRGEFLRRVRIVSGNLYALSELSSLLHPRTGFVSFALWSRKILRWGIPLYMMLILTSCAILAPYSTFFLIGLILQLAFYLTATIGFFFRNRNLNKSMFEFAFYLVAMNAGIFWGMLKFILGKKQFTWDPVR